MLSWLKGLLGFGGPWHRLEDLGAKLEEILGEEDFGRLSACLAKEKWPHKTALRLLNTAEDTEVQLGYFVAFDLGNLSRMDRWRPSMAPEEMAFIGACRKRVIDDMGWDENNPQGIPGVAMLTDSGSQRSSS